MLLNSVSLKFLHGLSSFYFQRRRIQELEGVISTGETFPNQCFCTLHFYSFSLIYSLNSLNGVLWLPCCQNPVKRRGKFGLYNQPSHIKLLTCHRNLALLAEVCALWTFLPWFLPLFLPVRLHTVLQRLFESVCCLQRRPADNTQRLKRVHLQYIYSIFFIYSQ